MQASTVGLPSASMPWRRKLRTFPEASLASIQEKPSGVESFVHRAGCAR
jgi:hypothetical protein